MTVVIGLVERSSQKNWEQRASRGMEEEKAGNMGTPYSNTGVSGPAQCIQRVKVWLSERNPAPNRLAQALGGRDVTLEC